MLRDPSFRIALNLTAIWAGLVTAFLMTVPSTERGTIAADANEEIPVAGVGGYILYRGGLERF